MMFPKATTIPSVTNPTEGIFLSSKTNNMGSLKNKIMGESVLHIPNIQDEAGIRGLAGIDQYKLRMLAPLFPEDAAIMPANTRQDSAELFALYDQLGIPHLPLDQILHLEYDPMLTLSQAVLEQRIAVKKALPSNNSQVLEPFMYSREMDSVSQALGKPVRTSARASEIVNNKYLSQAALRQRGVSVPLGRLVHSAEEAQKFCDELVKQGYQQVSFKLTRAASGMGVFCLKPEEIPKYAHQYAEEMAHNGVLIDGWITKEKAASPNIQYFIGDSPEQDVFISATDQILEGTVHKGNLSTNILEENPRLVRDISEIRNWTRDQAFRGIIGVDFYVATDGTPYYMEINARINGSTPGAMMMDKLVGSTTNQPWGVQNNIPVLKGSSASDFIGKLDRDHLTYHPDRKHGVLPVNTSAIHRHGKAMVLVVGQTHAQVQEIMDTLHGVPQAA